MICILLALAFAQDDVVFRSGVSLVRVDAEVSDATGRTLTGLKKSDFRVLDDGREQPIVNFTFEEEPLDVILLFDTGGNMRSKLPQLVRAVELGFHELRKGDRGAVMVFGSTAVPLAPFTTDFAAVNESILLGVLSQHFGGASKLVQAADDAARRLQTEPSTQRRRAILVITDKHASKQPGELSAVRSLWQYDAVLSELILDRGTPAADSLVEKTGGSAIASGTDPGAAFQESLRRIRRRYSLYYALPAGAAGTEHTVRVEVQEHPGARVYARTGYNLTRTVSVQ